METKLQINNSTHEAFLRVIMDAKRSGAIQISRNNEIGKYICSHVRYSNLPVRQSSGIILILPRTTLESGKSYYLYFTVEDQKKINDFLSSQFILYFRSFMLVGGEMNIPKFKLLEGFITKYNLQDNDTIYDNLKKSDYRNRKKITEFIQKSVQSIVL